MMIIKKVLTVCFVLIAAVEPQSQQQKRLVPDTVLSQPEQISKAKIDSTEIFVRKIDSVNVDINKDLKITQRKITRLNHLTKQVAIQNSLKK